MNTRNEEVEWALREWRSAEKTLRRAEEDGQDWRVEEKREECAKAFVKAVQAAQTTVEVVTK